MAPYPQTTTFPPDTTYSNPPYPTDTFTPSPASTTSTINVPAIALTLAFIALILICISICTCSAKRHRLRQHIAVEEYEGDDDDNPNRRQERERQRERLRQSALSMALNSIPAKQMTVVVESTGQVEANPPPAYTPPKMMPDTPRIVVSPSSGFGIPEEEARLLAQMSPRPSQPPTPPPPSYDGSNGYNRF